MTVTEAVRERSGKPASVRLQVSAVQMLRRRAVVSQMGTRPRS